MVGVPFQLPGAAVSTSPSLAMPATVGGLVTTAGPSSETTKKAEGMKESCVEENASGALVWLFASAPVVSKTSTSVPSWLA